MLAQNFKTAADLEISEEQLASLLRVLGMLERSELQHDCWLEPTKPNGFNMRVTWDDGDCGTVGCILGWAQSFNKIAWEGLGYIANGGLYRLFYPFGFNMEQITPEQAAIALRSYLTHGESQWAEALGQS